MATAATAAPAAHGYQGTEKLLWGIALAVLTFWLSVGTAGTVRPPGRLRHARVDASLGEGLPGRRGSA